MHDEKMPIEAAVAALRARFGEAPPLAIVLGSGLGAVSDRLVDAQSAPYESVGLPGAGITGHKGVIHVGRLGGVQAAIMAGRVHMYEGHPPSRVVRAVRALHAWGVKRLLLTCSVGGLRENLTAGDLVCVSDHINLQGVHPLIGPAWGTRFPDMSAAYDSEMRAVLTREAAKLDIKLHHGILTAMSGPSYETPAEVRMLAALGGDVVSMSTAPEVLAAREVELRVAAIAVVANPGAGLHTRPLTHDEVTEAAQHASVSLGELLSGAARALLEA